MARSRSIQTRVFDMLHTPTFGMLLALRLVNAMLVQTYIHPDETWQSLEVAHKLVFGYGFVTWEWRHGLRGFAHPMLFACVYKALQVLGLDDTRLITFAPYVLVAVIAASVDYATYYFSRRVAGTDVAQWTLFCSLVSCTMSSGVMRPLANSAETAFTAAAFVYWPWTRTPRTAQGSLFTALVFAALACIIRPTSGIIWICAIFVLLVRQPSLRRATRILALAIAIGVPAISLMLIIDRVGYGMWKFPPYAFYLFNVREGLGTWFGESHPLYHVVVSMPVLFTTMLPFVIHGVWVAGQRMQVTREPVYVAVGAIALFSLVGHMEYRFLYPLLPIGFMYAAVSIHTLTSKQSVTGQSKRSPWSVRRIAAFLLVTNIVPALYLNTVHQRGVVDVMSYLRLGAQCGNVTNIGFLMPCHSTPYYSHLHANIPMWFLSCEPPLQASGRDTHYWEAGEFEQRPNEFIHAMFANSSTSTRREKPSHLVLYDAMVVRVQRTLNEVGYVEDKRFFNTQVNGDERRRGDVVVYRYNELLV
ncbi:glycosylphosphatidylinositol anchor biosynthesis [Coemansia sp. RSA 1972]|nr:glycosylphosphatidylinositol anchor biosynthesis [Coemansia sp. RSA 1972]